MPLPPMVSHSLCATLSTVSRWPQNLSISGINGRFSSSPRSSRVAMISSALRTSTRSPTRRPFAESGRGVASSLGVTFLVRRRRYHDRLVAVDRGIGHAGRRPEVDNAHDLALRAAAVPRPFGLRGPCQLRLRGDLRPSLHRAGPPDPLDRMLSLDVETTPYAVGSATRYAKMVPPSISLNRPSCDPRPGP